jgi:hypothetical protein
MKMKTQLIELLEMIGEEEGAYAEAQATLEQGIGLYREIGFPDGAQEHGFGNVLEELKKLIGDVLEVWPSCPASCRKRCRAGSIWSIKRPAAATSISISV